MTYQAVPVRLKNQDELEGVLLMDGDELVAILCRLGQQHGDLAGLWFIEWSSGSSRLRGKDFPDVVTAAESIKAWMSRN
jgi:hypothetical protein